MHRLRAILFPGGAVLAGAVLILATPLLPRFVLPFLAFFSVALMAVAVVLSLLFHRNRVFFAVLTVALVDAAVLGLEPQLSPAAGRVVFEAICFLLPLNLIELGFELDRGVVTTHGRWRLALMAVEMAVVAALCLPAESYAAGLLHAQLTPPGWEWGAIPQPGLLSFLIATLVLATLAVRRAQPVESGFLWTLGACFFALEYQRQAGVAHGFFGAAALLLTIAVLHKSYAMAYLDELTELPGRRAFNEALLKLSESFAIAMVDVDHFKQFNDSYSHAAGDQVLRMVAAKLRTVPSPARSFRYGGEEFAIIFPESSARRALPHLEALREEIAGTVFTARMGERRTSRRGQPQKGERRPERRKPGRRPKPRRSAELIHVTVSMGVADSSAGDAAAQPAAVVQQADRALYRAKDQGRNCVVEG